MDTEELINQYKDLMEEKKGINTLEKLLDKAMSQLNDYKDLENKLFDEAEKFDDLEGMKKIHRELNGIRDEIVSTAGQQDDLQAHKENFQQRMDIFKKLVKASGTTLTELKSLIKERK